MGFQIGAFRFDKRNYNEYLIFFSQIAGLSKKAEIKIAGVKVGWVDQVVLNENQVIVKLRVSKECPLYENATGTIRQDGWFGPKYIEIIPGSSFLPQLQPGEVIGPKGKPHYDIDGLLQTINIVSIGINDVVQSVKEAVATPEGREQLKDVVQNIHSASTHISNIAKEIEETISQEDSSLTSFFGIGSTFKTLSANLESNVLPAFQESVGQIATVFDRDFNRIAGRFDSLGSSFDTITKQISNDLNKINSIVEKIDSGRGLLGKLINEDVVYQDIRIVTEELKRYIESFNRLQFALDTHFEAMRIPAENYHFQDSKGYIELRLYTQPQYFCMLQIVASEKGFITRKDVERTYVELGSLDPVNPLTVDSRIQEYMDDVFREQKLTFQRNKIKAGIQFGGTIQRLSLRFGIFDGSAGFGIDFAVGSPKGKFYWVTTLEAFDLAGFNRKHDRRPHLKWMNRLFVTKDIYFILGADDFVSKKNANIFAGLGICICWRRDQIW